MGSNSCAGANNNYNTVTDFLNKAAIFGEIVMANGHKPTGLGYSWTDKQSVHFFQAAGGSCPSHPPIVTSSDFASGPATYPPGLWVLNGSNASPYAWLDDAPLTDTSYNDELFSRGVLATMSSIGGHANDGFGGPHLITFLKEVASSKKLGEAMRIASNVSPMKWDETSGKALELGGLLLGDPLAAFPVVASTCADAPVLAVGKGDSSQSPSGTPRVRGFRKDAVPLVGKLDFNPLSSTSVYGNTLAAGNLDGSLDNRDEIANGHGNSTSCTGVCGNDSTVKVMRTDGSLAAPPFFAFPSPPYSHTRGGVTLAVAELITGDNRKELLAGRGPVSAYGPTVRGFRFNPATGNVEALPNVSYDAFSGVFYGVTLGAGDTDLDGYDEIVEGKGPGPTYGSTVAIHNADNASTPTLIESFDAFTGVTYGVNAGTGYFDSDSRAEITAGKGPGDQSGSGMDSRVKILRRESGVWTSKATWIAFADPNPPATAHGGARAIGFDWDGALGDELAVIRGAATNDACGIGTLCAPPWFQGSNVRAWDIDTSIPSSWTFTPLPFWTDWDTVAFSEDEPAGSPSTLGGRLSRIWALPLSYPSGTLRHENEPIEAGSQGGGSDNTVANLPWPQPMPWWNSLQIASGLESYLQGADPELFSTSGDKSTLQNLLATVKSDVGAKQWGPAKVDADELVATTKDLQMNLGTQAELLQEVVNLQYSIERESANRAPVVSVDGGGVWQTDPGMWGSVKLWAGYSIDDDSTKGTADNIKGYRWYRGDGSLVAEGPELLDVVPPGTWKYTVEVEDVYGATSTKVVDVSVVEKKR